MPDTDVRCTKRWIDTQQRWLMMDYFDRHCVDIFQTVRKAQNNRHANAFNTVEMWTQPAAELYDVDDVDDLELTTTKDKELRVKAYQQLNALNSLGYILATFRVRTTPTTLQRIKAKIKAILNESGYYVSVTPATELPTDNPRYQQWSIKEVDDDGNATLDPYDFKTLRQRVYELRQNHATAYEIRKWCRVNNLLAFLPTQRTYLDACEKEDNEQRAAALNSYFLNDNGRRWTVVICPDETKSGKALYGDGNGRLGKTRLATAMARFVSPDGNAFHHYIMSSKEVNEKSDPLNKYQSQPTVIIDEWTGGNIAENRFTELCDDRNCALSDARYNNIANVALLNCLCGKNPWQSLVDDLFKVFKENSINQAFGRIAAVIKVDGEFARIYRITDYKTGALTFTGRQFCWCPRDWMDSTAKPVVIADDFTTDDGNILKSAREAFRTLID